LCIQAQSANRGRSAQTKRSDHTQLQILETKHSPPNVAGLAAAVEPKIPPPVVPVVLPKVAGFAAACPKIPLPVPMFEPKALFVAPPNTFPVAAEVDPNAGVEPNVEVAPPPNALLVG